MIINFILLKISYAVQRPHTAAFAVALVQFTIKGANAVKRLATVEPDKPVLDCARLLYRLKYCTGATVQVLCTVPG
nr:MAG TPA: hypothetical protein [Caudoviricetes sp.]